MAETLRRLGFVLIGDGPQLDLDKASLDRAVQQFGARLQGADVALFYYAGHGIQVRGANYLVPIDANPVREADVDFQTLDVALVLRQMEAAGTRLNMMILDACRNNPFGGRGLRAVGSGLANIQAPEGTLVSYATQPGNVAQDGIDGHSPYSKALVEAIQRPGMDIFQTFNEVGLEVKRATGGSQQPWVSSSPIAGNFYFAGAPAGAQPAIAAGQPPAPDRCAAAGEHWKSADAIGTEEAFKDHLARFPNCGFAGLARAKIDALRLAAVAPQRGGETGEHATAPKERHHPYDGTWKISLSGNQYCKIRSIAFPLLVENGEFVASRPNRGTVDDAGHFRFTLPSKVNPKITLQYSGTMSGDRGEGRYHAREGACGGTMSLQRLD
jgi:hypothetical protein